MQEDQGLNLHHVGHGNHQTPGVLLGSQWSLPIPLSPNVAWCWLATASRPRGSDQVIGEGVLSPQYSPQLGKWGPACHNVAFKSEFLGGPRLFGSKPYLFTSPMSLGKFLNLSLCPYL